MKRFTKHIRHKLRRQAARQRQISTHRTNPLHPTRSQRDPTNFDLRYITAPSSQPKPKPLPEDNLGNKVLLMYFPNRKICRGDGYYHRYSQPQGNYFFVYNRDLHSSTDIGAIAAELRVINIEEALVPSDSRTDWDGNRTASWHPNLDSTHLIRTGYNVPEYLNGVKIAGPAKGEGSLEIPPELEGRLIVHWDDTRVSVRNPPAWLLQSGRISKIINHYVKGDPL